MDTVRYQKSISYQEIFNTFNTPAITKPFNRINSVTNLAYVWICSLSWLLLCCLHYELQEDLGKKSWETGHMLQFSCLFCDHRSQKMQSTVYFYYYYTLVKNQRLRHVPWNDILYAVFSTYLKCYLLCGYVSMHFVLRPVLFDTVLYAVDIALCGLQNSSEPMF